MSIMPQPLAFEMRGHADDGADGDDAGTAHAGDGMQFQVVSIAGDLRIGDRLGQRFAGARNLRLFRLWPRAPSRRTDRKPFTQEKSLLQLDWSIWRLRPYSVSSGCTATQFDWTEQSPQPSQTSSLMITRLSGSGNVPRLRRRRFSEAQVWS